VGRYCFKLSFTPKSVIASAERLAATAVIANAAAPSTLNDICPDGFRNAAVYISDHTAAERNLPFQVLFN